MESENMISKRATTAKTKVKNIEMSSRSSRMSVDIDPCLSIQGLSMDAKPQNNGGKLETSHASCKKEIEKLKRELNIEKNSCKKLKVSLSDAKKLQEDTKASHVEIIASLKKEHKEELDTKESKHINVISCMNKQHREEILSLEDKHKNELESEQKKSESILNEKLKEQTEQYESIISTKNEQIESLKTKVAESLKSNSIERHKQIDDLMKELKTVSDEAGYLKGVIDNFNKAECQKCRFYENKCREMAAEMATRNENFKALLAVCSKMETQLSDQDDLCMLLANLKKAT